MPLVLCEQRQRLLRTDGHIIVRGGAGSGKTTIALAKACEDLASGRIGNSGKALFLSFARATIAQVAEQATATLPKDQLRRIEINTYHGFAWSVLKSHAYLLGTRPGVSLLLSALARKRLVGLAGDGRARRQRQLFDEEGLVAFDLFPVLLAELLEQLPVMAQAFGHAYPTIIVDEFQDTNDQEWAMISRLGQHSRLIALGDPKQRIYDFKGASPRRFNDFIEACAPTEFDFFSENNRSAGTDITSFADAILEGVFRQQPYTGVSVVRYAGRSLRPLKQRVLETANRLRWRETWSLAVLVPSNTLAAAVFDCMQGAEHGLPRYPVDIVVSEEGPMLAGMLIALLLEPRTSDIELGVAVLEALAAFEVGRSESASAPAITRSQRMRTLATAVRTRGDRGYGAAGVGPGIRQLLIDMAHLQFAGDPVSDWRAVRTVIAASARAKLQSAAKEARRMRLLRRGTQIEPALADAWRTHGAYVDARSLLRAAVVEDQFAVTGRAH